MSEKFAWLTRDFWLKAFSLGLALALYLFVSVENDRSVEVQFPVEYRTADDIELIGPAPSTITVTIAGPWASVRSYDPAKLVPVRVDLRDAGPGSVRRRIEETDVSAPGGMTVVGINPNQLDITLDRKVERQIPVTVDTGGDHPAFGFEVSSATAEPDRVRVVGPATVMQTIEAIYTRPIELAGREEGFTEEVELRPPVAGVRLRDKLVTVNVEIREEVVTRTVTVPVRARELPPGTELTMEPDNVKIELRGPRRALDAFDKQAAVAYVDITTEVDDGVRDFEKNVFIDGLPERCGLAGAPPTVHVKIGKMVARRRGKG
jgi:YbbR domain-containing protein